MSMGKNMYFNHFHWCRYHELELLPPVSRVVSEAFAGAWASQAERVAVISSPTDRT